MLEQHFPNYRDLSTPKRVDVRSELSALRHEITVYLPQPSKDSIFALSRAESAAHGYYTKTAGHLISTIEKGDKPLGRYRLSVLRNCFAHYASSPLHQAASRSAFARLSGKEAKRIKGFQALTVKADKILNMM